MSSLFTKRAREYVSARAENLAYAKRALVIAQERLERAESELFAAETELSHHEEIDARNQQGAK